MLEIYISNLERNKRTKPKSVTQQSDRLKIVLTPFLPLKKNKKK
jgi:hypothetical protein